MSSTLGHRDPETGRGEDAPATATLHRRMISVRYGGEDPANIPRRGGIYCWCGEANGLFLIGDKFYCDRHRPKEV